MKHAPSQIREDHSPRGNTRFATAPCHGTCGGDELHKDGDCIHCGARPPKQAYRVGVHSVTGRKWK
jgi:hypothetical protein